MIIRSSNPGGFIVWCAIGLCAGLYLFFNGFRLLKRRHLILNTPVSKIRGASLGTVELSGLAAGPYTIPAPVTARLCYYYRTLVWEWKQSGKNKRWVQVAAECMHVPFFLDDNTGKVMVDPRGAELDLHRDFQQEFCDGFFTTKQEVPPNVRSFLSRHGINTTNKIKVEEFCIKPKNALFLLGTLDENPGLELAPEPIHDEETTGIFAGNALSRVTSSGSIFGGLSLGGGLQHDPAYDPIYDNVLATASARAIRLSPVVGPTQVADMTQQQKVAAALMKAGISNLGAWATAGVTTSGVATSQNPNDPPHGNTPTNGTHDSSLEGFDPRPPVVLMKGKNNPTFLISWRSQRDVVRTLGWKCALMIWGGPAVFLLSLYGMLTLTHLI